MSPVQEKLSLVICFLPKALVLALALSLNQGEQMMEEISRYLPATYLVLPALLSLAADPRALLFHHCPCETR